MLGAKGVNNPLTEAAEEEGLGIGGVFPDDAEDFLLGFLLVEYFLHCSTSQDSQMLHLSSWVQRLPLHLQQVG